MPTPRTVNRREQSVLAPEPTAKYKQRCLDRRFRKKSEFVAKKNGINKINGGVERSRAGPIGLRVL